MKALILAAGKGERFFPFNVFRPKPMFPICNRPLLDWTVSRLVDAGITDIGIVVGHRGGRARNYFGEWAAIWLPHDLYRATAAKRHGACGGAGV